MPEKNCASNMALTSHRRLYRDSGILISQFILPTCKKLSGFELVEITIVILTQMYTRFDCHFQVDKTTKSFALFEKLRQDRTKPWQM